MPKKNSRNAQGSGTIRKRNENLWEGRYTVGVNPTTGKQIQKSIYASSQKEVAQKLRKIVSEIEDGTYVEPSKMELGQWLDIWLQDYTANIKENTLVTYETQIRLHIKEDLGKIQLAQLVPHQIQSFYNKLRSGETPLSAKTVKNVHGVLHRALEQACLLGYIKSNPCEAAILPRIQKPPMHVLDGDKIKMFLDAAQGNEYADLFEIDIFTGMRQSEIMGLQWSCVDFSAGTIYVDKQLIHEKKKGGIYKFAPPKNDKPRTLTPAPWVMDKLKKIRKKQIEQQLFVGQRWKNDLNLVFTDGFGHHYCHNTIAHNCKKIAIAIGCPNIRFHDLRHTYAVCSLRAGDDVKTVQANLGHHTAAFTLDQYAQYTDQMRMESSKRMESFISKILG